MTTILIGDKHSIACLPSKFVIIIIIYTEDHDDLISKYVDHVKALSPTAQR